MAQRKPDVPRLAGEIKITREGMTIDGEEFPWYVSVQGFRTSVSRDDQPMVTVDIVAERLLVDDDLSAKR